MEVRRMKKISIGILSLTLITLGLWSGIGIREAKAAAFGDFEYVVNGSTVEIVKYTGTSRDVQIPEKIEGLAVTSIGGSAFSGNLLTSVTIPDSVTSIGGSAFSDNQLTRVTISNRLTSIEPYAFYNNKLTNVTIPSSVERIEYFAFSNNRSLTRAIIEGDSTYIGDYAFWGSGDLTMISFDSSTAKTYASTNGFNFRNILSDGVNYSPNGESLGKQSVSTTVTVAVPNSVLTAKTHYRWTTTSDIPEWPDTNWVEFTSGASIITPPTAGTWYLHVRVDDQSGKHEPGYSHSEAFKVIALPGAPTNVTATAGNGTATISFDAPVSDGGSAITGYTVTSSPGGFKGTSATASPITVTGLTNGTAYTFTVVATNCLGDSAASAASASVTPAAPQATPTVTKWPTASNIIIGQTLANSKLIGGVASVDGKFSFADPGTKPGLGTHSFEVIFTPNDTTNYITVSSQINVTAAYQFSGILQPINANGTSLFKAGSTIPVKFSLKDASGKYVSTASATLSVIQVSTRATGTVLEDITAISNANTGNAFRYDPTANQYIYNLSTKGWTTGDYQLTISINDGQKYTVKVSAK